MLTRSSFLIVETPGGHYSITKDKDKYDRSFLYILLAVCGGKKDRTYTGAWRFPTTQRKMGSANPGSPAYEHWKLIFVIVMFTFWSRNVNK